MPRLPDELPGNDAGAELTTEASGSPELGRRARAIGALLWASFLAACAGTMFFFAFIAPEELLGLAPGSTRVDRMGVYTLGFFGLWALCALASSLTLYVHGQLGDSREPKS